MRRRAAAVSLVYYVSSYRLASKPFCFWRRAGLRRHSKPLRDWRPGAVSRLARELEALGYIRVEGEGRKQRYELLTLSPPYAAE